MIEPWLLHAANSSTAHARRPHAAARTPPHAVAAAAADLHTMPVAVDELMPIEEDLEAIRSGEVVLMGPAAGSAQKNSESTGAQRQPQGRSTDGRSTEGRRSAASMADTAGGAARSFISYEVLSWLLWGAFTIWWIVDRFTTQISPRQGFSIGGKVVAGDPTPIAVGPWTVKFYDVFARVSGRFLTPATNVLLVTRMHGLMHYLRESRCFTRLVDMSDCDNANDRMHIWWGWLVCVCTLVHVWSIFGPPMFHGYSVEVKSGTWEWPASERKPSGFKDVSAANEHVMLQVDDVWRLVEMTALLGVLVPYSYRWLSSRYHLGIVVHNFISAMYVVDIIRRHTHPHNWFMNTPVFFLWLFDRAVLGNWWRRTQPQLTCMPLSDDYMLLAWNQARTSHTVGPRFFFRLLDSSWLERAHVVTGFERRLPNFTLPDVPATSIGHHFTSAAIVRVYHERRCPVLGSKDKISHTHRILENLAEPHRLHVWGPFVDDIGQQVHEGLKGSRELCLVASGSAVCYLLDALQQKVLQGGAGAPVTCLYTCRDAELFAFVVKMVEKILGELPLRGCQTIRVILSLTDNAGQLYEKNSAAFERTQRDLRQTSPALSRKMRKRNGAFALLGEAVTRVSRAVSRASRAVSARLSTAASPRRSFVSRFSSCQRSDMSDSPGYSETIAVVYSRIDWQAAIPPCCALFVQGAGGVLKQAAEVGRAKQCEVVSGPIYDSATAPRTAPNTTKFLDRAKTSAMGLLGSCLQCPGTQKVTPVGQPEKHDETPVGQPETHEEAGAPGGAAAEQVRARMCTAHL